MTRLSEEEPGGIEDESAEDIGDHLEVPAEERLDVDDYVKVEANEDEMIFDFSDVPDGEIVELSTATPDEYEHEKEED